MRPAHVEAPPDDPLAVGREERPAVVARHAGQPLLARAVGAHDVNLGEVARIDLELLLLGGGERPVIRVAHRREHDPLAVGRVAALGVVAARVGQPRVLPALLGVGIDLELGVVVPRVAPLLARRAEVELVLLQLLRLRIVMRRRKQDLIGAGAEERAGRLAVAGRDALGVARGQVERVDLVEGIARLALALKDEPLAVRRPVAFAGAAAFDRQPADARQEVALFVLGRGLRCQSRGQSDRTDHRK